jgi:L-ascorbate metabolism protein UlaG (beta-lactamase superfamily)
VAGVELWWLGQAGFRLRDPARGPTLFIDPFLNPRPDRSWQAPIGTDDLATADLVLATHEHSDHLDKPALKAAAAQAGSRFSLVLPRPLVESALAEIGLPAARVIGAQPEQSIARAGITIHPVPASHGVHVADAYNFGEQLSNGQVRYLGYVVVIGGVRVYHAGDCIPYAGQIERLRALQPHIALLPINGRDFFRESERNTVGNMDAREAARLAHDAGAQLLIPMHWELFAHNRGFPAALLDYVGSVYPELSVLVLGRGARFTYLPASL